MSETGRKVRTAVLVTATIFSITLLGCDNAQTQTTTTENHVATVELKSASWNFDNVPVGEIPDGGNRNSGIGREGLRFAIDEMTNIKMVAVRVTY